MKDIKITKKRQLIEIRIVTICFIMALLLNALSILIYKTALSELWSQLLWVIVLSIIIYFFTVIFRILFWLIKWLIHLF